MPAPDTVFVLACGPSLCEEDVARTKDYPVVAVSDAIKIAPWAKTLYSAELKWWNWNKLFAFDHRIRRFTTSPLAALRYPLELLTISGDHGVDFEAGHVRSGHHSGYTAINVAVHMGPRRIILLGYDMQPSKDGQQHFFGDHPDRSHLAYRAQIPVYATLRPDLERSGIEIINCSRETAIPESSIPRWPLESVL